MPHGVVARKLFTLLVKAMSCHTTGQAGFHRKSGAIMLLPLVAVFLMLLLRSQKQNQEKMKPRWVVNEEAAN